MRTKDIALVTAPQSSHWVGDGFFVHNFIPSIKGLSMQEMDPFILLDYNALRDVAPTDVPGGVDVHPHRGFETVTIAYEGEVEHADSAGHGGVIGRGDVQWMTAAKGILHREFHGTEWAKKGGPFQMVQLWTNLPAKDKMSPPKYQSITNASMGKHTLPDGAGMIEVIAGEYQGTAGPATTHSPIYLMNAKLNESGRADFSFPASHNTALLVVRGAIRIGDRDIDTDTFVKFARNGEDFTIEATRPDTVVLVMSGEPLREPIAAYGPFVMNSKVELLQAFEDFNNGRFGHLDTKR
ncbi:pirin family protein [Porphyromonas cangingivalis]|uniref:Short-chain dehydrogenase n=2 Tax=Porphyromonas cangingivalis TaxID=36874 RepID=A0A1T4JNI0_PORCN|nr:pirin family protein [Porphyromonas cangingivalis]SJZ31766.1 hypothetical protein SAMN02745205_00174 [Porphyromonas cangingivalis]VEJ04496.1 Quercetin 2,3-dioxygenase [Porphyromonas cangingivalis]